MTTYKKREGTQYSQLLVGFPTGLLCMAAEGQVRITSMCTFRTVFSVVQHRWS